MTTQEGSNVDYKYEKLKTLTDERVVKGDQGRKNPKELLELLSFLSDSVQTMKLGLGGREN